MNIARILSSLFLVSSVDGLALSAPIRMTATVPAKAVETAKLLPRERYIASNRFKVRDGAAAKFEARWANRKSRLATLEGFRYFTLLRQVPLEDVIGPKGAAAMGGKTPAYDYMSYTIWEDYDSFSNWRNGEAFKEAHGGTSIGAFLTAMVSSLAVLKGPPSPVFYDGLLHLSNVPEPDESKKVEGGWRVVDADGQNLLPAECFIAANRFAVREGAEEEFEERWSKRDSQLNQLPGFKSFTMLRRDGSPANDKFGDDFNYMSFTVWADKDSFMNWRNSQSFKDAHSSGAKKNSNQQVEDDIKPQQPPWTRPPSVAFWEGILELSSPIGA
uniref:ABM domain-containing protein n=1 Tax=Aureoumbra lagunensis TaxID=44058 RepID=A0A7S3JSU2_9STRA